MTQESAADAQTSLRPRRSRRTDPMRRERLIDVALDVIALHGVAGTTHRKVADAADVPLGSMTYHFRSMDELLEAAFVKLAGQISRQYDELLARANTREEAIAAVVEIIAGNVWASPRTLLLSYELYGQAARNPGLKHLPRDWMNRSRQALERHFDARTARALDALIEGLGIHSAFELAPMPREEVERLVRLIAVEAGQT